MVWVIALIISLIIVQNPGSLLAGDKFPSRPVDFLCPFGIGGGADRVARSLSPNLKASAGVPFPVMNARGGAGQIGLVKAQGAPADGYMPLIMVSDLIIMDVIGKTKLQIKDFQMIGTVLSLPNMLWVKADSPFKTIQDVIDEGKKRKLKFGVPVPFSVETAEVQNFGRHFGLKKIKNITNPKFGKKIASFMGGQVDVLLEQYGDMKPYFDAKEARPILFFGPKRLEALPDVPCSGELGIAKAFEKYWFILVRKGTPADRVAALEKHFSYAAHSDAYKKFLEQQHTSISQSWLGTKDSEALLKEQYAVLTDLAKELGWLK
jgi:tripartite-type tricarboxylate transporter receptor subunit TctC